MIRRSSGSVKIASTRLRRQLAERRAQPARNLLPHPTELHPIVVADHAVDMAERVARHRVTAKVAEGNNNEPGHRVRQEHLHPTCVAKHDQEVSEVDAARAGGVGSGPAGSLAWKQPGRRSTASR
jgi:hypothetical protein